ncbi:MAG: DCC1-like thiol-disulfide oxidoreductase family protein, partial [Chitinophagales bacterium]|nr:DCC1-like thiol-disulfide oxidoreductase family protein [Chitinophagales bacterium]
IILAHDKKGYFSFAALQSSIASRLLRGSTVLQPEYDSVILIEDGKVFLKSEAALRIARNLSFPWKLLILFRIIPLPLRDKIYDFIARNRYKWFGKDDKCLFIQPKWKERFLDLTENDNH